MTATIFVLGIGFTLMMSLRCSTNKYDYQQMLEDDGK